MFIRDASLVDVGVAGFAAVVGAFSLNTAIGLWRNRNGGLLLRGLVFKLLAFTLWTFEILGSSIYQWHMHLPVDPVVRGATNLDRLTLAVPMAVLLIWIVPAVGKPESH